MKTKIRQKYRMKAVQAHNNPSKSHSLHLMLHSHKTTELMVQTKVVHFSDNIVYSVSSKLFYKSIPQKSGDMTNNFEAKGEISHHFC